MDKIKLSTKNVSIEFPGVKALEDINFEVSTGEIRAVVGANGAGKSTLMKVLSGANPTYSGKVFLDDKEMELRTPVDAKKCGVQIVYQEVDTALFPNLTVAENIVQSDMVMDRGNALLNWNNVYKEGRKALERLHISRDRINERELVSNLSLADKQMVLIAKAIRRSCNFLILDEPTAPLSNQETKELFKVVEHLHKTENIAILFISHRLNEILEICESYTVMRNGKLIGTYKIEQSTTTKEIVELMLGRTFEEAYKREEIAIGDTVFKTENLNELRGRIKDINIYVRKGEILGIAGLVGAGKSELCKTLFGAYKSTGKVVLDGKELNLKNPAYAVRNKIALVPEERRKEGVLVEESVSFNLSAASLDKFCNFSFIDRKKVTDNANEYIRNLNISTPSVKQSVKKLSGGNQQKVAVGKWLAADCGLYIFDEPTKGVDVGAKQDIFHLIHEIAKKGNAVIYATCENQELLALTDRIYVMYNGSISAELVTKDTNEDEIMYYSVGGKQTQEEVG